MKICLVSHQYLPEQRAGVEIIVHRLALALQAHGHEVCVYATKKDLAKREGQVVEQEFEGVRNLRVIRNLFYRGFGDTFEDPLPGRRFCEQVLDGFRPDLVHVHHLMHHSLELPQLARSAGVPVLMTLHDYWLACPRFGQLLDHEERICESVDLERCSACLTRFTWRNPPKLQIVARGLEILRRTTGLDLQKPLQERYRKRRGLEDPQGPALPDPALRAILEHRREAVLGQLIPAVDRFLCPSLFLMSRMQSFGFPSDKLLHQPLGVPFPDPMNEPVPESEQGGQDARPLRVAYMGSVLPHKGVHLLLDAFEILLLRGVEIQMAIHGGSDSNPTYGEELRSRAEELGVRFTGSYLPARIGALLAGTDLCIVPSLWFENRPNTILDARVHGVPSLVSDLGGMAELVPDPRLRFAVGDARDLARQLEGLSEAFARSFQGAPEGESEGESDWKVVENLDMGELPPDPEEDLQKTLEIYASICR